MAELTGTWPTHTVPHTQIYNSLHLFKAADLCLYLRTWNAGHILYNNCYDLLHLTTGTLPVMLLRKSENGEDILHGCYEDIPERPEVSTVGNS